MKKITVWVTGAKDDESPSDGENVVHMTRLMANENFNDWKADPGYDARRLVLDKLTISGAGWREVAGHAIAVGSDEYAGWPYTSTTGDADSEWKTVRERQPRKTRRRPCSMTK
jgi:hypothetical protein